MLFAFSVTEKKDGIYRQGAYLFSIADDGEGLTIKELAYITNVPDGYGKSNQNFASRLISRVLIDGEYVYTIADHYVKSYLKDDLTACEVVEKDSLFTAIAV